MKGGYPLPVPSFFALDFLQPGQLAPVWSFLGGVLLDGAGLGAVVIGMARATMHLSAAQREERVAFETKRKLHAGPRRVVKGVVEADDPDSPVVTVTLVQVPEEHRSKNNVWYTWEERDRRIDARPFYLVTEEGERVYVEPAVDVLVADRLTPRPDENDFAHRTLGTTVKHGDTVRVSGDLHVGLHPRAAGVYRDAREAFILRFPTRGRMVIATGALADRYTGRLRFLRLATAGLAVAWLALLVTVVGPFLSVSLLGTRTEAHYLASHTYETQSKNRRIPHYVLETRTADGLDVKGEIPYETYAKFYNARPYSDAEPTVVPVLVDPLFPHNSRLGMRAGISGWALLTITVLGGLLLFGLKLRYKKELAWYDSDHVSDHGGTGPFAGR